MAHTHDFSKITGSVRDLPSVGLEKCSKCNSIRHDTDVRSFVSYESGTMHNFAKGYGGSLPQPFSDQERRLGRLVEIVQSNAFQRLLDFGCGTGEFILNFPNEFECIGLDPDTNAISDEVKSRFRIFEDSKHISDAQIDIVTMFHVIEHLYEPREQLSEIRRILKPGGMLVIETPNANDALLTLYECAAFSDFTFWSHHPTIYSLDGLLEICVDAGFEVLEATQIQRYGLANHLHWLARGKPGGHEIWSDFFSEGVDDSYSRELLKLGKCDTNWVVARKSALS